MQQKTIEPKAIVLLSGGLDSSTAAAIAISEGYTLIALSYRYGQRHERELISAQMVAQKLGITQQLCCGYQSGSVGWLGVN